MYLIEYELNGDALVFLHCSRGNHKQWNGIVDYFNENYYVITPDLRGHGKTTKLSENYTLENIAWNIESAHFVGSSFGAVNAEVMFDYPNKFSDIIKNLMKTL